MKNLGSDPWAVAGPAMVSFGKRMKEMAQDIPDNSRVPDSGWKEVAQKEQANTVPTILLLLQLRFIHEFGI